MSYLVKDVTNDNLNSPASTTSTVFVMMGLAMLFTAKSTGRVLVSFTGDLTNETNGDGVKMRGSYGTGTPPSAGGILAGIQFTPNLTFTMVSAAAARYPFHVGGIINAVVGTEYWLDLAFACETGGTARCRNIVVSTFEI